MSLNKTSATGRNAPEHLEPSHSSRRSFIKNGGMILAGSAIVGSNASIAKSAHAFGSDTIKLGLIGAGWRGTKAAIEALNTSRLGRVEIVAIGDAFANNLHSAYRAINGQHTERVADPLGRFVGLDAYQGVLQSDADVVILAAPPAFRPQHFHAAVAAGKHVVMEKPVAVDVDGARQVMASGLIAEEKRLAVAVGLQRRHERRYQETIDRLRQGIIGDPVLARTFCQSVQTELQPRRKNESEQEYRLRNWMAFDQLSGGAFVERHIQNLDVINWLMDAYPVQARNLNVTSSKSGKHPISVEFTYANGTRLISQCGPQSVAANQLGEQVRCSEGTADISAAKIVDRNDKLIWRSKQNATKGNGWQASLDDFFTALRRGERPNETNIGVHSTMAALLGQMASKCSQTLTSLDLQEQG